MQLATQRTFVGSMVWSRTESFVSMSDRIVHRRGQCLLGVSCKGSRPRRPWWRLPWCQPCPSARSCRPEGPGTAQLPSVGRNSVAAPKAPSCSRRRIASTPMESSSFVSCSMVPVTMLPFLTNVSDDHQHQAPHMELGTSTTRIGFSHCL